MMDDTNGIDQVECAICALNEAPGPVNGADIAELTDVIEYRLGQIEYVLYRHLPLRKRVWWKLTELWSGRRA